MKRGNVYKCVRAYVIDVIVVAMKLSAIQGMFGILFQNKIFHVSGNALYTYIKKI